LKPLLLRGEVLMAVQDDHVVSSLVKPVPVGRSVQEVEDQAGLADTGDTIPAARE